MPYETPKLNWLDNNKYNAIDWNRLLNNMNMVYNEYSTFNYQLPPLVFSDSASYGQIKYLSDAASIDTRIETLYKNTLYGLWELYQTEFASRVVWTINRQLNADIVNWWENRINDLWTLAPLIPKSFVFSGSTNCGQSLSAGSVLVQSTA